jgi:nicotinic acid mononucleotide adenylyltransferase
LAVAVRPPMTATDVIARLPVEFKDKTDVVQMSPIDVSSTEIRDRLALGKGALNWLPDPVLKYIQSKKLYKA